MFRRSLILAAALVAAAGVSAAPAAAHPNLLQAAPAPGIAQPAAPQSVTLAYSETPVARGSEIKISGGVKVGKLRVEGKSLTAPLAGPIKPGVYTVTWTTLGDDGHQTAGTFNFGVDGKGGSPPPGAERLSGAGGTGTGKQSAAAQGALSVIARWGLILSVSLLFGGGLLAFRSGDSEAMGAWRRAAPLALVLALTASVESVLASATAGANGSFDFGLITATEVGVAGLIRFLILLGLGALGGRAAEGSTLRDRAWGAAGGLALVATAFDGHVSSAKHPFIDGLGQIVHVVAAGTWLGAIIGLAVLARWGGSPAVAARRFAPIAGVSLAAAVVTGIIAALREVHAWYFLRWSSYGQAVIVKSILVAIAAGLGLLVYRRAGKAERSGAMRFELYAVVVVAGLASLLAAIPQGRGQLLPALRGNLLPGPAFSTIIGPGGKPANITLAPARTGANRFIADLGDVKSANVRLACTCHKGSISAGLKRNGEGQWAADVKLPKVGTWYTYVSVDNAPPASPAALSVGVPRASGAPAVDVLAVADLSGPDADRCRDYLQGLQLGIGRINLLGGLDGHHKVALLARDDEGNPALAGKLVDKGATVLAGACGPAAGSAVAAASQDGIPSIVGDPGVPAGEVPDSFRTAGDPAAEGYADAKYAITSLKPQTNVGVDTMRVFAPTDTNGKRWVAGWRAGLAGSGIPLDVRDPKELLTADQAGVRNLIDRRKVMGVAVDGSEPDLAAAIKRAGKPANTGYAPTAIIVSARTYSESMIADGGVNGREGVLRGLTEVSPDSKDALAYSTTVPKVFPGSTPSLEGIRGYVAGLAFAYAAKDGIDPGSIRRRLREPSPFTDALASPYRSDAPDLGSQRFQVLGATFLTTGLVPVSQGGEAYSGTYFPDGAWERLSSQVFGPVLSQPPLGG